ncbi:LysR family transcriptional regulator, partial [Xanthomonas perforans]
MDRLGDIALFLRVLDLGSITAGARSLDLSVAVASQRLKRLERELGVRLLHRTTRRLHPTAEGQRLAERGRVLVEDLDALAEDLRESAHDVGGVLRMTMSASFGRQYVSPLLPEFQARHPRLRISAHLSDDLVDLVKQGFDLAIRIRPLEDSGPPARSLPA